MASATARASTSEEPPAVNVTTMVNGRSGYEGGSARAASGHAAAAPPSAKMNCRLAVSIAIYSARIGGGRQGENITNQCGGPVSCGTRRLLRLDIGRPDNLSPFLGIVGD